MSQAASELVVFSAIRAIDPSTGLDEELDVVVERGVITRVGKGAARELLQSAQARIIQGSGRWLLPAFVDLHSHLREPGQEYKEDILTGLGAAAAGGFAHVCAMPNTKPVNDTRALTEMMIARAREVGGPRLHPIGAITMGQKGQELTEMGDLKDAGAVAVSDDGRCVTSSAVMRRALEYARTFDLPVIQHAEDHALTEGAQMHEGVISTRLGLRGWPRVAEDIIVARDVLLAEVTGARYHVAHVSSLGAVRILREAKARGLKVTAEVTPHHLLLTDAALLGYDTACKVNPPLRTDEDVAALRAALADGTIDVIATDHAPHSPLEKDCEFGAASPGVIGLETCFPLLLGLVRSQALPLSRLIEALTVAPARVISLMPPSISEGVPAALVMVVPEQTFTVERERLRSKSHNTPFLGRALSGAIVLTMSEGAVIFDSTEET
ncbi:MAG TPA: dihydroorotase [Polyangiaceae bacterium]